MRWLPIRHPSSVALLDAAVVVRRTRRVIGVLFVAGRKGLLTVLSAQRRELGLGKKLTGRRAGMPHRTCRRLAVGEGGNEAQAQGARDAANDQKMFHRDTSSRALPSLIATFDAVLPETDANGAVALLAVALFVVGVATLEARRSPVGNDCASGGAGILQSR
jgi:hypothetical protein